ncbi:hypothetical protein [Umezawaea tangerina]|uniref:Uncharacterized protein n=1 Tax=Umezawaea tangerina TaxID=84725 RepID=A0A2T0SXU4_9PSEU|nr:hypothetical protein [Umezawaea tangerina]PRY38241.1 hypothetical protein CLV43_109462 [Umezawaea tangerina]
MFRRKANRIAELERVVARVQRRLDEANERLAEIGGFEYEKVRRQVEGLRAEAERVLRERLAAKLRFEAELAERKTAQVVALAHARAAVEAELGDVRRQIAEARQELRQLEERDGLARPESLRPLPPLPRDGEAEAGKPPLPRDGEAEVGRPPLPRDGEAEVGRAPQEEGAGRRPLPEVAEQARRVVEREGQKAEG